MQRREIITLLGGVAAWPLAARAQRPATPVIGYLSSASPETDIARTVGFRKGLNESGFFEGQNVVVEYHWADGDYGRLPELAADFVRRQVTVIAAIGGTATATAAKRVTSTIPIVFNMGADPIQLGLVSSLNRPGTNLTGVVVLSTDLAGKRLQLLKELLPSATSFALLVNPTNPASVPEASVAQQAAQSLGVHLDVLQASTASELDVAFEALKELRVSGLVVAVDSFFTGRSDQIVKLAAEHAVPTVYGWRSFTDIGGLMSYAPNIAEGYRSMGILVGRILKGDKPADLPVEQVSKVEFIINLKSATALGLTFSLPLIGRANEVIE
ncbi:MAG TPA: ABC transporter substrate-binding protein [Bradyrhizobium sp.]|jgi:putative ABC transport system substrate-binding protein|nr:ABC transporter substrate-binding protein [Bradyrhizobium sp.]